MSDQPIALRSPTDTAWAAYRFVWQHSKQFWRAAAAPVLLLIAFDLLRLEFTSEFTGRYDSALVMVLSLAIYVPFLVSWHHFVLRGEQEMDTRTPLVVGSAERRYFVWALLACAGLMTFLYVYGTVWGVMTAHLRSALFGYFMPVIISGALLFLPLVFYAMARLVLILPHTALGRTGGLRQALEASRPVSGALALRLGALFAPVFIIKVAMVIGLYFTEKHGVALDLTFMAVDALLHFVVAAAAATMVSWAFQVLVEGEQSNPWLAPAPDRA